MLKTKKILVLLVGFSFLQVVFITGQAFFLSKAIVGPWNGGHLDQQLQSILFFFIFYPGRHVVMCFRERVLDTFSYERSKELREQLLIKIFRLGSNVARRNGTGNVVIMALEGISQTENYLQLTLTKMMNIMIIPWIILAFVFTQDIRPGVTSLIIFPIIIIFMTVLGYIA